MKLLYSLIFLSFLYQPGLAQEYVEAGLNIADGIYYSIKEINRNAPSVELENTDKRINQIIETNPCLKYKEIATCLNVSDEHIKNAQLLVINQNAYVKHPFRTSESSGKKRRCFYRLFSTGSLAVYYIINHNSNEYGKVSASYDGYVEKDLKVQERILDLRTGELYRLKGQVKKIRQIIKSDSYFADEKIKKKDLLYYVMLYNKRHPIYRAKPYVEQ